MRYKLPAGFQLRHPNLNDLQAVTNLIVATDRSTRGESDFASEDLLSGWNAPNFDLNRDAWVVTFTNGRKATRSGTGDQIVAYEELWNQKDHARLHGDGYVHPEYRRRGLGTFLLHTLETHARQQIPLAPAEIQVSIRNGVDGADSSGRDLHEHEGYQPIRYFWRMRIEIETIPDQIQLPEGTSLRTFHSDQDEHPLFNAMEEAFSDHWGHIPWEFDWWRQRNIERPDFDPGLWFLAQDGDQIAGGVLGRFRKDIGWVGTLGVRPKWRRKGLGLALLQRALAEFFRRGMKTVELTVDAQNPTGATALYERAGMQRSHEYVIYEKVLRPGIEPKV